MDALSRLRPHVCVGERLTLRLAEPATDLIGFVVCLDPLRVEDRHGRLHELAGRPIVAARRVGVALGRDPATAPRDLLDELAGRAGLPGLTGTPELLRISDLLAGRTPPAQVFEGRGTWTDGQRLARVEGEWLTTDVTDPDLLVALAWWATRQNARSIQVVSEQA
jgi:hypothetical protein